MEDLRNDLAAAEGEESLAFATAITEEASALEAETEKFLDEALISDFQETPLTTLESVIEERQQANERRDRVQSRAKELLELEIAKEKHEKEVKDLEDAISATAQPAAPSGAAGKKKKEAAAAAAAPAAESSSAADDFLLKTSMPFKLESADRNNSSGGPAARPDGLVVEVPPGAPAPGVLARVGEAGTRLMWVLADGNIWQFGGSTRRGHYTDAELPRYNRAEREKYMAIAKAAQMR